MLRSTAVGSIVIKEDVVCFIWLYIDSEIQPRLLQMNLLALQYIV